MDAEDPPTPVAPSRFRMIADALADDSLTIAAKRELLGELVHHISIEPGGAVHLSIRQGA